MGVRGRAVSLIINLDWLQVLLVFVGCDTELLHVGDRGGRVKVGHESCESCENRQG